MKVFPTVFRVGATPVPIPTTEVKPHIGDGTADFFRGRVARRWDLLKRRQFQFWRRFFCMGASHFWRVYMASAGEAAKREFPMLERLIDVLYANARK